MQIKNNRFVTVLVIYWLSFSFGLTYSQFLFSLPQGASVAEGSATMDTAPGNPNHQIITQTTPKTVINWSSFNIDVNQITEFRQPSSDAIALNRVVGGDPSLIMGSLKANGQVWLVNPAGILFGKTARVDVGSLLATTADIRNSDFMNGNYLFTQPSNRATSVINEGQIRVADSGFAYLVAPGVRNSGVITANLGKVTLGSGTTYTLDLYGDGLIHFALNNPDLVANPRTPQGEVMHDAVRNSGDIFADGGKVLLTTSDAKQVVENLINMDGVIKANTAVVKKGEIYLYGASPGGASPGLVKVTGKMSARGNQRGEQGGKVTITGKRVGLFTEGRNIAQGRSEAHASSQAAHIDVSGEAGGGEIYIGGGFQGKGDIPHAEATIVSKESKLFANALTQGEGGKIIAWSDKATWFYGTAHAKGGVQGGNGGVIETSGKWLDTLAADINASSPRGTGGLWLLDPFDVTIADAASQNGAFSGGNPDVWTPNATASRVDINDIIARLDAGTSVTVNTDGGGGAENGDILSTFPSPIIKSAGGPATYTLNATRNISIIDNITDNVGNLTFIITGSGSATTAAGINIFVDAFSVGTGSMNIGSGISTVRGNTSGSNITFTGGQGAGPFIFNGNDITPSSGGGSSTATPSGGVITSTLNPGNFTAFTGTGTTSSNTSSSSNIDVQNQPQQSATQQQQAQQSSTSTTSDTTSTDTSTTTTTTSTTTTSDTSTSTSTDTTTTSTTDTTTTTSDTTTGSTNVDTSGAVDSTADTTADAPSSRDVIGGGAEGQETVTSAEGTLGSETAFPSDPQDIDMSDPGGRSVDPNLSPEYNEGLQSTGPVSELDLNQEAPGLASDSGLAQEANLNEIPVGPDSLPSDLGQELIESAEGTEGQEGILEASDFDPNQGIDRSHDDLERVLWQPKLPVTQFPGTDKIAQ